MELTHQFTVPAPVGDTWAHFNDIAGVAGCFPGATVTGVEGDEFTGTCKVKLGPIALTYAGTGKFLEKDESTGRFTLEAKGKDKRGNGTAAANVTASFTDAGGSATDVVVVTDLAITGKPAQFGRGLIQDVSDKLLEQFIACLEQRLETGGPAVAAAEAPAEEAVAAGVPATEAPAPGAPAAEETPLATAAAGAARIPSEGVGAAMPAPPGVEEENVLDLGATVLPILVKSYWRQILGAVLVLVVLRRLLRRRRT